MLDAEALFSPPTVPVEVRVPERFAERAREIGVPMSRALKIGAYALLAADEGGDAALSDLLGQAARPRGARHRITVRIPLGLHDLIGERMAPLTPGAALSVIASLFALHPETVAHV